MKPVMFLRSVLAAAPLVSAAPAQQARAPEATGDRLAALEQLSTDQDELLSMVQRLKDSLASEQAAELGADLEAVNDPGLEALWAIADDQIDQNTVLAENEVIERLLQIARKTAGQGGQGQGQGQSQGQPGDSSAQAMLNMMEQMAGRQRQRQAQNSSQGQSQGNKPGDGQSNQGGQGGQGGPGSEIEQGDVDGGTNARRVPSAAGNPPVALPEEYREDLESYFRALEGNR